MLKQWSLYTALVMALCLSPACLADEIAIQQDEHGINYVTGGIGSEEVEALEAFKKQFDVYLLFSEGKVGRLVDGVSVTIVDARKQTVFSLEQAAPRLLLSLPSGKFTVIASYQGSTQRYTFNHLGGKHQRVILNWRNVIDEDAQEPEEINDTMADY